MADSGTQDQACAEAGAVVAAHQKFEPLVGTFKAEVKMWWGPDEHVSSGVMVNTLDLGGRYLRQDYKGDAADGPFPNFQGRGFFGFNTVSEQYEGFWIDTASTFMSLETGTLDDAGKTWTMTGTLPDPQTRQPMHKRSVITVQDANHHSMETFLTTPDGNECKIMEITYTRAN